MLYLARIPDASDQIMSDHTSFRMALYVLNSCCILTMGNKKFHKRIKKYYKLLLPYIIPPKKEILHTQKANIPLNIAKTDRISFSVLRNNEKKLRKIENISYDILLDGKWEWVVRYDDHGGSGPLHRHVRISLKDQSEVRSTAGIKKYKNKDFELTWVCDDIKRNYFAFRKRFMKNSGLAVY